MTAEREAEIEWKKQLYRARDECLAELAPPPLPPEVYHYTSPSGLLGILGNQSVWATHLDYMNDVSELRHAEALFGRIVARAAESIGEEPETVQHLFALLEKGLSPFGPGHAPYAFCTCEGGNLLSQWRTYGSGGQGYSIGLDTTKLNLQRKNVIKSSDDRLRPIIYDELSQQRFLTSLFERVTRLVRERHAEENDRAARQARLFLMFQYMEWAPAFKNELFAEEREWRWMSTVQLDEDDLENIRFRPAPQYPIPYVELSQKTSKGEEVALPITRILTGPGVVHERAKATIETIYRKRGEEPPSVEASRAPVRQ